MCRSDHGFFEWPGDAVLASPSASDLLPLAQLRADLGELGRIERNAFGPASVRVRRERHPKGREAYRMTVAPDGVEIFAGGDAGAYYAVQTLREMTVLHGRRLPACRVDDWPDLPRRGLYLDCSRGKVPTLATLRGLAERLGRWRINELQLYVENVFTFRRHPAIGRGCSPFRPEDILRLQDACREHHVRLVGSLASFGHMERIVSMPEYRHLGEGHRDPLFPWGATLCPTDPRSLRFMEELYEEYVPLFEADDFNICCDETWEIGKARSREAVERLGAGRVYLDFFTKLCDLVRRFGKRPNAWADVVLNHPETIAALPRDVVMLNWDYSPAAERAARTKELTGAGLAATVCPATGCGGSHTPRLAAAMENIRRTAAIAREQGAEGLLVTSWGDDGHRNPLGLSLQDFAYAGACAWNGAAVDDASFLERFCRLEFGDRTGALAAALSALGRRGWPPPQGRDERSVLYYGLVERVRRPPGEEVWPWGWWWKEWHAMIGRPALRRTIARLSPPALRIPEPAGLDAFGRLTLEEWRMAARMDVLAARRILAVKDMNDGRAGGAADRRALAADMRRMAADFRALWLKRNRSSQVRDNMAHFARAAAELERV